jgi:hypothetical protein
VVWLCGVHHIERHREMLLCMEAAQ